MSLVAVKKPPLKKMIRRKLKIRYDEVGRSASVCKQPLPSLFYDTDHLGLHLINDLLLSFETLSCGLNAVIDEVELFQCQVTVLALSLLLLFLLLVALSLCLHFLFQGLLVLFLLKDVFTLHFLGF